MLQSRVVRKKIKKIRWGQPRNLALATLIFIPLFLYRPLGRFVLDRIRNLFTNSHLYDRYDRKWVFRSKPNLSLIMVPINPAKFQRSEEVQNLIWAYCWGLFVKKYTTLDPVIILNIPNHSKPSDLEQMKDTISTLHEQLIDLYRDPLLKKLKPIEIIFENDNSFRKSQNIGDGTKLLIVNKNREYKLLPLASAIELHSALAMSFISEYTDIGKSILDQALSEAATALQKRSA